MTRLALILISSAALALGMQAGAEAHFISQSQANSLAVSYQRSECGFAWNWVCNDPNYTPGPCYAHAGEHTWYCSGYVVEGSIFTGQFRYCDIDTHWYHAELSYHYNQCRH